jgi:hypothetical protein
MKDLNVISEMVKLLQEKIGNTLDHIGIGNNFMNRILITQQLRESVPGLSSLRRHYSRRF